MGFFAPSGMHRSCPAIAGNELGTLETLFQHACKRFVDEIFFTGPCEREALEAVLIEARARRIDVRVVPYMCDGITLDAPIEFIGQFPTVRMHSNHLPETGLFLKRGLDSAIALLALLCLAPLFLVIAIAIKVDSPGPVLYCSDRFGKKARAFRFLKFQTWYVTQEAAGPT